MSFPPTGHLAPPPAPDRSSIQTNAIILIVVGVMCGGMVPMVFGIIALTQLDSDPEAARRMNKIEIGRASGREGVECLRRIDGTRDASRSQRLYTTIEYD